MYSCGTVSPACTVGSIACLHSSPSCGVVRHAFAGGTLTRRPATLIGTRRTRSSTARSLRTLARESPKRERLGGKPTPMPSGRLEPASLGKKERLGSEPTPYKVRDCTFHCTTSCLLIRLGYVRVRVGLCLSPNRKCNPAPHSFDMPTQDCMTL